MEAESEVGNAFSSVSTSVNSIETKSLDGKNMTFQASNESLGN